MRFPKAIVDVKEYNEKLIELLNDQECIIFLDTNILALLFRLHSKARAEFFEWIKPFLDYKRIKVPAWVVNEYSNRFIYNNTSDYLSTLKKVQTVSKDFKEIESFLGMFTDSVNLKGTSYKDREALMAEVKAVAKSLSNLSSATNGKTLEYELLIHKEITDKFENAVIKSNIFEIIDKVEEQGIRRFNNKIPPGFKDGSKGKNSLGDLVIWSEIINYCKVDKTKKVIFLTNDGKKDWIYAPNKIKTGGKAIPNKNDSFKIIDNRLVYEFYLNTNSEDIYITNFDTLITLLLENKDEKLYTLARAIQLIQEEDKLDENSKQTSTAKEEVTNNINAASESDNPETEKTTTIPRVTGYSQNALADSNLALDNTDQLTSFILGLKSYNWYSQNDQLDVILSTFANSSFVVENSQDFIDKLFVIGRNIYQAANGGAFKVMDFMENLHGNLLKFNDLVANHLYSGMFYEVYFNSAGQFRLGHFKTSFFEQLFSLQSLPRYQPSIEFIFKALKPFEEHLLVLPNVDPINVTVTITYTKIESDFYNYLNEIQNINALNKSLITIREDDIFNSSIVESRDNLEERIKQIFVIPSGQVEFVYNPPVSDSYYFYIPANKELIIIVEDQK